MDTLRKVIKVTRGEPAVLFSHDNKFWIKAAGKEVRFILLSAKPLKEPIAWGGPIVMNTNEELQSAFEELDNDTFVRKWRRILGC